MQRPGKTGIILMGMKHSGKSSLGRMLASERGVRFLDLDDLLEEEARLSGEFPSGRRVSCREIYRQSPALFARFEAEAARTASEIMAEEELFLALGGGTIENSDAMELLKQGGTLIYLDEAEERLYSRIIVRGLPPFLDPEDPEGSFHRLYLKRTALYRKNADRIIALNGASLSEALAMVGKSL